MSYQDVKRVVREIFHHTPTFNPRDPEALFDIISSLDEPLSAEERIRLMTAHATSFHDVRGMYETPTRPLEWNEYPFADKVMMVAVVAYHTHYRFAPPSARIIGKDHYADYVTAIIIEWMNYKHKIDPSRYNLPERCRSIRNFMAIMNISTTRLAKVLYAYMANTAPLNDLNSFGNRNAVIERITNEEKYNTLMFQVEYRLAMQTGMNPNSPLRIIRTVMDEMSARDYDAILQLHLN